MRTNLKEQLTWALLRSPIWGADEVRDIIKPYGLNIEKNIVNLIKAAISSLSKSDNIEEELDISEYFADKLVSLLSGQDKKATDKRFALSWRSFRSRQDLFRVWKYIFYLDEGILFIRKTN
jgi:hypothetical protein